MRTLIVLDINGVICNKTPGGISGNKTPGGVICNKTPGGIRISPYYCVEPIMGYMEFAEGLAKDHSIAWFSSTTERNASKILKLLGVYDIDSVFKWYSDMTDNEGRIKNLDKVKEHYPNFDKYIIVDDSYDKISGNDEHEIIVHTSFHDTMERIMELTLLK